MAPRFPMLQLLLQRLGSERCMQCEKFSFHFSVD
jgi:hypothetical protein